MSATTIWEGLQEQLLTVPGLNAVILGEPTAVHEPPAVYVAYERSERATVGQVTAMRHFFLLRLIIVWQERAEAEAELLSFANAIPAAIDADPTLGGRISRGLAKVTSGLAGFLMLGSTTYRVLDFAVDALEKGDYQGGI